MGAKWGAMKYLRVAGLKDSGKYELMSRVRILAHGAQFDTGRTKHSFELANYYASVMRVGARRYRQFESSHYATADLVLFVIDCADLSPLKVLVIRNELALATKEIRETCPILFAAHKSDLAGAASAEDCVSALDLWSLRLSQPWSFVQTSARSADGVRELMDVLFRRRPLPTPPDSRLWLLPQGDYAQELRRHGEQALGRLPPALLRLIAEYASYWREPPAKPSSEAAADADSSGLF